MRRGHRHAHRPGCGTGSQSQTAGRHSRRRPSGDRKSTRLNSSHSSISYAVFCLMQPPQPSNLFPYTTLFRSPNATMPSITRMPSGYASPGNCAKPWINKSNNATRPSPRSSPRMRNWLAKPNGWTPFPASAQWRSEEHTSELQSQFHLVCRLLLDAAATAIEPLSLHDALPISERNHAEHYTDAFRLRQSRQLRKTLDKQIEQCDEAIATLIAQDAELARKAKRLDAIPGVGPVEIGRAHV